MKGRDGIFADTIGARVSLFYVWPVPNYQIEQFSQLPQTMVPLENKNTSSCICCSLVQRNICICIPICWTHIPREYFKNLLIFYIVLFTSTLNMVFVFITGLFDV